MSLDNDYRLRGYSISGRRPVATLDLSYDHDSGVYLNAAASAALTHEDHVELVALQASLGYARRVSGTWSIDGGVVRTEYPSGYTRTTAAHYTELYLGVTGDRLSSHVYFSPDYLRPGVVTLYGEVDAVLARVRRVRISGHIGLLETLDRPGDDPPRKLRYDWRIGASRPLGAFELRAALTGGGPGRDYYARTAHSRTAVTFGASWFF